MDTRIYLTLLDLVRKCLTKPETRMAHISATPMGARTNMRMCFEIVTPLFPSGDAKLLHQAGMIKFSNGSSITFMDTESKLRGVDTRDIVRD